MAGNSDDDNPFIIKMDDEPPVPEHGIGYEVFHEMKKYPENTAQHMVETEESQSYEELLDNCVRVAINLKTENISDDDIIGLCVGNHKHACVAYIAGLFLGKIVTALDPAVVPREKASMLQQVTPKIIFVDENSLENMEESLKIANLSIKLVVIGENSNGHSSFAEFLNASDEAVKNFHPVKLSSSGRTAVIFFSSGTNGVPKGICISHRVLLARTTGPPVPVAMIFAQLNWISYALLLFRAVRAGTARVLMENFEIEKVWPVIGKYRIFALFASIYQIADFAKFPKPPDVDISDFKILLTGGSALPPDIFLKLTKLYPDVLVLASYGLTEIGGTAIIFNLENPIHRDWQLKKPSSCGTPIHGIWYKIVDPDTEEILGPNRPGELRLKSKLAMNGYHQMNSSGEYDSAGWLKTGDILQYDEDHCFFVVDRIKEFIKYRSWSVSPSSIEHVLMLHPAVEKAAVIGIPNNEESDFPMGIVSLREGFKADPKELEKFVEDRVMDRQRLRAGVKILKEIPLTSTGKVQRRILRKMAMTGEI